MKREVLDLKKCKNSAIISLIVMSDIFLLVSFLKHSRADWKSIDKWSFTCVKSILKISLSNCVWFCSNFLFSLKVAYFLTVSVVFSVYKQNFTAQLLQK